ncbi:arrestin domain-containing protein 17-like [Sitodiplosis mosellana]|uniref:arrestin domain-containing protein 17-like n=1 Tax=Sitodiplosis mosellana TaxID=263140 RepID=UPI002444CBC5|nr:arrestin domain-containing protein 17-like [Sitodiplosis mosellana]
MPTTCIVDFENNPEKVIYAGQLLRGTVQLTLTEEKNVRGVFIQIRGEAYAHWSKKKGKRTKNYTGEEIYLDEKTYFVGGSEGEVRISPGTYNYTFQCLLPAGLPSSIEGKFGHIRYTANVVLDIPMWVNKKFVNPFTVIKPINLNDDRILREPISKAMRKTFLKCCCCATDALEIVVRVPVGGYTPGQFVNLEIEVKNKSNEPVSEFTVELVQKITHYANNSRSTRYQEVSEEVGTTSGCDTFQNKNLRVNFEIPPVPPTDCVSSNIIHIEYAIHITGSVGFCHGDPVIKIPIKIGTYPIQDGAHGNTVAGTSNVVVIPQPTAPVIPDNQTASIYPTALGFQDDPPTYEEATRNDNNEVDGDNFKPKYPMFRRQTSYSIGN